MDKTEKKDFTVWFNINKIDKWIHRDQVFLNLHKQELLQMPWKRSNINTNLCALGPHSFNESTL